MTTYLDIGAVRIQHYLARSPTLRGRRGASALLSELTSPEAMAARLGSGAAVNSEAGEVDGTLSLIVQPGTEETVATELLDHLRAGLPAAEFQAAWGDGDSYVDAYATTLSRRFDDGTALLSVPAAPELPLLAPCQRCRLDPAVAQVRGAKEEGTVNVCADCAQRELAGGRRTRPAPGHPSPGLAAEERLSRLVAGDEALDWVDDFGALAKLTGERDNHLATVLADGNSMGRFFQRLAASGSPAKRTLSRRFAEATFQALAEATAALRPESGPLPVIPHVVGGDDVVVSVPARLAWPFLRGYLRAFERLVREAVKATAPGFAAETPTASAAVVFAHHTYPFQRCVTVGDELLAGAKTREAGARSSVLWVDVTREGEQPPASRRPWTIEELARLQDDIAMLAPGRLAKHARSALALGLARPDPDVAAARARLLAERLGVRDVVRRLLHDGDDGVGGVGRLGDALELGRWWP